MAEFTAMDGLFPATDFQGKRAKIKVVGVGGGGGNAINRLVSAGVSGVDLIALNSDAQDLRRSKAPFRLQLGEKLTNGLGVGGDPDKGKAAATESVEYIRQIVRGTDLLIITAGMGGGTGTGASPVVAQIAKEMGGDNTLVFAVVTRPFESEGSHKDSYADRGINELRQSVDSLLVVPNERIFNVIDRHTPTEEAFRMVDDVLLRAIRGISDVINKEGEMNMDFNDVKRVMAKSGEAIIGIGECEGENRHIEAALEAIECPLLENDIKGAKGLLVHYTTGHGKLPLSSTKEANELIKRSASKDVLLKFGITYDDSLQDRLRITVIATGFPSTRWQGRKNTLRPAGHKYDELDKINRQTPVTRRDSIGFNLPEEKLIPAYIRRRKGMM